MKPKTGCFLVSKRANFLVDWLSFTIRLSDIRRNDEIDLFDLITSKLFLKGLDYQERRAMHGYMTAWASNGITICFGGRDDIFINLSGSGCRAFEEINDKNLAWEKYLSHLFMVYQSLHVSRLDIACDTFGRLNLMNLIRYTRKGQYISQWRTYLVQEGNKELSVVFGSKCSDFRCRLYDKTLERVSAGAGDVPLNWVRIEFQMRDETALSFLKKWIGQQLAISDVFLGILQNQLMYYTSYDGKNRDRMRVVGWWKSLIGATERMKMSYQGGMEYNCERLRLYVLKQAASSINAYVQLFGVNDLKESVEHVRLNDRQKALLASVEVVAAPWDM